MWSGFADPSGATGTGFRKLSESEGTRDERFGNLFHFSLNPTVTAGFIGFSFDITKYSK
jgi:hypothetical protein